MQKPERLEVLEVVFPCSVFVYEVFFGERELSSMDLMEFSFSAFPFCSFLGLLIFFLFEII